MSEQPRILLVDDEPSVLSSLRRLLERQGLAVNAVTSGDAALASLRCESYSVIVSDLQMPGLSGQELFGFIAQEFPWLRERTVFTSGDLSKPETQQFLEESGCTALEKPFDLPAFIQLMKRLHASFLEAHEVVPVT